MEPSLLALDCGTQSFRAILFSRSGEVLAKARREYEPPYVSASPGWAEQDAELYWRCLCETTKELEARAPEAFARICGVGVTTQRDTLVLVDEAGSPLRPAILWLDTRQAKAVYRPPVPMRWAYRAVGMLEAVLKTQKAGKLAWVQQEEPEVWARTARALQVSGFLNHRLTGVFKDSVASQIGHLPFDYKRHRWAASGHLNAKLFPVSLDRLPDLEPAGATLGHVTASAAAATGLAAGLPVVACASDKGCESLGIGCVNEGMAAVSFGTTATVQTATRRYYEPLTFMPPYPAAIAGHYNPEVEIFRGYWMISWFKREFAPLEAQEALEKGVPPEVILDRYLREVPAGCLGLVTLPHWSPSLKLPAAKGAMVGFGDVHTRGHVYRSVLEGLGFALREGLERIEKAGKKKIDWIGISGGATQSEEICQLTADVFGRTLFSGETFETASLGAAILVAVGTGLYPTTAAAVAGMVRHGRSFTPRPEPAALYERLYQRVFKHIFPRLHPLFAELRELTNYPERIEDE
jgi:sugar (pentulose or hexulose) kinase